MAARQSAAISLSSLCLSLASALKVIFVMAMVAGVLAVSPAEPSGPPDVCSLLPSFAAFISSGLDLSWSSFDVGNPSFQPLRSLVGVDSSSSYASGPLSQDEVLASYCHSFPSFFEEVCPALASLLAAGSSEKCAASDPSFCCPLSSVSSVQESVRTAQSFVNVLRLRSTTLLPVSSPFSSPSSPSSSSFSSSSNTAASRRPTAISVVGAGPIGLLNAAVLRTQSLAEFAASPSGAAPPLPLIRVFDRRPAASPYVREHWFDIYSHRLNVLSRSYPSLQLFQSFGLDLLPSLHASKTLSPDDGLLDALTVPCSGLEKFLLLVLHLLDVSVTFDTQFSSLSSLPPLPPSFSSHHLLVLALGPPPSSPSPSGHGALIVTLSPSSSSSVSGFLCPPSFPHASDPHAANFELHALGITSVFRRFEHRHCELQVFFRRGFDADKLTMMMLPHAVLSPSSESSYEYNSAIFDDSHPPIIGISVEGAKPLLSKTSPSALDPRFERLLPFVLRYMFAKDACRLPSSSSSSSETSSSSDHCLSRVDKVSYVYVKPRVVERPGGVWPPPRDVLASSSSDERSSAGGVSATPPEFITEESRDEVASVSLGKGGGGVPAGTSLSSSTSWISVGDMSLSPYFRLGLGLNHGAFVAASLLPKLLLSGGVSDLATAYGLEAGVLLREANGWVERYVELEGRCNFVMFLDEVWSRRWKGRERGRYTIVREEGMERDMCEDTFVMREDMFRT